MIFLCDYFNCVGGGGEYGVWRELSIYFINVLKYLREE